MLMIMMFMLIPKFLIMLMNNPLSVGLILLTQTNLVVILFIMMFMYSSSNYKWWMMYWCFNVMLLHMLNSAHSNFELSWLNINYIFSILILL